MSANIVSLHGAPIKGYVEPETRARVVRMLADALERAKASKIAGIRIVEIDENNVPSGVKAGDISFAMLGVMVSMTADLERGLDRLMPFETEAAGASSEPRDSDDE